MSDQRVPIVIDIETEPDFEWIDRTKDSFIESLEPPKNYKTSEAIGRWIDQQVAERVGSAPLSPIEGCISAIACVPLWGTEPPWGRVMRGHEKRLICEFLATVYEWSRHNEHNENPVTDYKEATHAFAINRASGNVPILAGWHINTFDVPFLSARAALHSLQLPDWWPANTRRYGATIDAADILREGRLSTWLQRFGLPPKLGDGKDAQGMPEDQLLAYVINDVRVEAELLRRLSLISHEIAATNTLIRSAPQAPKEVETP